VEKFVQVKFIGSKRIMSSGSRSTRSASSSDTAVITITASEVEEIVRKAVSTAVEDIKELFNSKLAELNDRVTAVEDRLEQLEQSHSTIKHMEQSQSAPDLSTEINAVREETRQSLLLSNDNEQYSRRNNLRIFGFKPEQDENSCTAAVRFVKSHLHVPINDVDIEMAHMTNGPVRTTSEQQRRPTMLIRFRSKEKRDQVIRARRSLKGTHFAISEDLTALNIKTMNRLRNNTDVRTSWSWNGKIFAILSTGDKVTIRPFQSVAELMSNRN